MNRDDIILMAREAELYEDGKFFVLEHGELERFAALVAAAEREACALIAQNRHLADESVYARQGHYEACKNIAAAIRARSKT